MQGVDWTEADRVERAGALEPFGLPMYLLHVNAHAQFMSQLAWATQCSTCVNISSRVFWFDIKWFLCGFCWNISGIFKVRFLTFLYWIFRVSRPQISKSSELFLRLDCQKWLFLCFDFDCSKTFVLWRCPNSQFFKTYCKILSLSKSNFRKKSHNLSKIWIWFQNQEVFWAQNFEFCTYLMLSWKEDAPRKKVLIRATELLLRYQHILKVSSRCQGSSPIKLTPTAAADAARVFYDPR